MKFAEFAVGDSFSTNPVIADKKDMIEYAEKYDPQYFHIDENAAKDGPFGSLIASGFYSMNAVWADFIRMDILGKDCLGGLGIDEIRWTVPVRPEDTLIGEYTISDKRLLSDKKRGILSFGVSVKNQEKKEVLTVKTKILISV
ncbi:acyl dehydratase [Oceanobacillus piezotolerans]|uniref:Acyl dehydratase n=1 Tax=Oceanobacillus piezotolerans TaxID=2448030 RepID=A0A498DCZ8_9BACI|nr:MaoC/PaaZ C-terminal domain-containing protein [Oceanobacillus piezotolerans]RLL46847.1 acyl dehydratase [Oceanobacillus piezotolerans]